LLLPVVSRAANPNYPGTQRCFVRITAVVHDISAPPQAATNITVLPKQSVPPMLPILNPRCVVYRTYIEKTEFM
jgi:hypothetical protein